SLEALRHQAGPGRPLLWDERLERVLASVLAQRPTEFGYFATGCTVPLLQQLLANGEAERTLSPATIRRRLRERGYVWKRFRYVLAPDPQQEKKTPAPPATSGLGRAHRALGPGRNRVAAAATAAGGLGAPG